MPPGSRTGFTLIELLVVIVILSLLLALILPSLIGAMCAAREADARGLISQLNQAAQAYWVGQGKYPPGDGSGSDELAYELSREGPRKLPYFDFVPSMLWRGHVRNPAWADAGAPRNIIYYRNNSRPAGREPGGAGNPQPPVYHRKGVDLWAAGCAASEEDPSSAWSLGNW